MSTNGKYFDDTGIPFPAPAGGVLSGGYFMHGGICCVARTDEATAGADVACDTRGVFELPKAGVAVTAGDELYDSAGSVTNVQSGTLQPIGCAFADALIGATTVDVVLNKGIEADSDVGTLTANLASTANAKGASLVGIEDAGLYYATGTVEAALQEIGAAGFGTQLTAAAVVAAGNLVEGVGGARATVDSGIAAATLPTMAAVGGAGNLVQTAAADRAQSDSGIAVANVPQMAAVGGAGNFVQTAAADRAQSDSGVAVADVAAFLADPNIEAVDLEVAQADASDGLNFVPFMIEVDCTAVAVDGIAVAPVKHTDRHI